MRLAIFLKEFSDGLKVPTQSKFVSVGLTYGN
jgi:hypothetical protein